MLRFAPLSEGPAKWGKGEPSGRATVLSSIGGDEQNVAVCLSRVQWKTQFVTVLPAGIMGDMVIDCSTHAGVQMEHALRDDHDTANLGLFFVIPDEKRVQYQRRNSSFGRQSASNLFDWRKILLQESDSRVWVHMTGITPLCGTGARENWRAMVATASALQLPVSLDLNHRPALGSLEELWAIVAPTLPAVRLLVLSRSSLCNLGRLFGLTALAAAAEALTPTGARMEEWVKLMQAIHLLLKGPILCVCFKIRDKAQLQTRWSVAIDGRGVHTTLKTPVMHVPKDECGGGSAWSSGFIDQLSETDTDWVTVKLPGSRGNFWAASGVSTALRRADLLAALCQEQPGDHSMVTRAELSSAETMFHGRTADISTKLSSARL